MTSSDAQTNGLSTEGVVSLLDTDLYKLTMQSAVLRAYPTIDCSYRFTNRTPDLKLNRRGFAWLQSKVTALSSLALTSAERDFLQQKCPYLPSSYLDYLASFRFRPAEQVALSFKPISEGKAEADDELGEVDIDIRGLWVETILYEIPLLVLVSEAFFRFSNTDWDYANQEYLAFKKAQRLLSAGCIFSEFGTRRRRSYHTQNLVLHGLTKAASAAGPDCKGKLTGTSNVHFAHKFGLNPIGTVAHEWFMGIAAIHQDYTNANEIGLREWIATFGEGTLSIALTDTFGTPQFLKCFARPSSSGKSYAEIFAGTRQDSGSPEEFVQLMRRFYDDLHITSRKTIVFSDSLDVEKCIAYKSVAEAQGFDVSFGVGTFLTNDFVHLSTGEKSVPLNIVIKIASANGKAAVKISDNRGKNTGDTEEVRRVKEVLGYVESKEVVDEADRWGAGKAMT